MVKRGLVLIGILLIGFVFAVPNLLFVEPTPEDDLYQKITSATINVSVNNDENTSVFLDWNNSLIGYWSFEYYNSTGVYDNSSYSNFGTFEGNLTSSNITSGVRGNALDFKRTNRDRVNVGNINVWENFTLSAWVYRTDNLDYRAIFGADGVDNFYLTLMDNDGIMVQQGGTPWISFGAGGVTENQWHHVVLTHDSSNRTEIYVDGSLGNNGSIPFYSDESTISHIGSFASVYSFEGSIDEVMIFNRTLSPEEILYIYNSTESSIEFSFQNLSDGTYPYSVYAINGSGELEIQSRTLGVDSTPTGIDFVFPTPANELYLKITNPVINVSITQPENKSIWMDWNNSLVGYWSFDYSNSTGVYDNSSYGNFGEFNGGVGTENLTAGKRGYGLEFDGVSDYVQISDDGTFDFGTNNFTVSTWVYLPIQGSASTRIFLSKWNTGATPGTNEWLLEAVGALGNNRHPTFVIEADNTSRYIAWFQEDISLQEWHLITGMRDGEYIRIYVNGELKNSTYVGNVSVNDAGRDLIFGRLEAGFYFNGSLDEVMIFNRSLSQEEILGIYNSTAPTFEYSLSNLNEDESYEYSVYSMDIGGNMEILSRNFTTDFTGSGLSLIFPTPENELYTKITSQTINATFTDSTNKSVWIDWNNSLVGYWSFDYYNSTGIFDNSSYGNFGVFDTNISLDNLVTGVRGQALEFSINDDMNVNLGTSNSLYTSGNMTLSFWMKSYSDSPYATFYCRRDSFYVAQMSGWDIMIQQGNNPWGTVHSGAGTITQNQWHNIVITHREDNWTEIYIDGDLKINESLEFLPDETGTAYLGGCTPDSGLLNGSLDEVMIFNRTLSYSEILYLYNSTASTFEYSVSDLEEGNYNYSVYSIDNAGNLEIESREFTVDTTPTGLNFVFPTPADELYSRLTSQTINVTFDYPLNKSVWLDWNNSLVGYWSFDYSNSTGVYDNSSYSGFATFGNDFSEDDLVKGERGKGLNFDGVNDYLIVPSNSNFNFGEENFSVFLWVKANSDLGVVLSRREAGYGDGWGLTYNGTDYYVGKLTNSSENRIYFNEVNNEEWKHLGFVRVGNNITLYVNGEYKLSNVDADNNVTVSNTRDLMFGNLVTYADDWFNGTIDEVTIFNRSLSQEEILGIYDSTSSYFEFDRNELTDGNYNYSVYSMDIAGNLEIESRGFTVDTTGPGLEIVYPSPTNELYTRLTSQTINATFTDSTNKSVWIDWNDSLLGYWSFDYVNSTGIFDNSSNSYHGEYKGNMNLDKLVAGPRGQGMMFNDSENDYIDLTDSNEFDLMDFTISLWGYHTGNGGDYNTLISRTGTYKIWFSDTGGVAFQQGGNPGYLDMGSGETFPTNEWHHIVLTHNSTNWTQIYVNGVLRNEGTLGLNPDSSATLKLGAILSGAEGLDGGLDEVMFFNRVLGIEEILYLYNSTEDYFSYSVNSLDEGEYNYSVYAMDNAGNLEIESREFTVDTTPAVYEFLYPTPSDDLYTYITSQTINVSGSNEYNESVWIDWEDSLLGYWSMDYYNSTGIFDNSSYDNFGNFVGNLSLDNLSTGARGQGIKINSNESYIEVNESEIDWGQTNSFTVSFWNKPIGPTKGTNVYYAFLGRGLSQSWGFFSNTEVGPSDIYFRVHNSTGDSRTSVASNAITVGEWNHVVGRYNGTHLNVFVNGVQVSSSEFSGPVNNSGTDFQIGRIPDRQTYYMNGTVDEVMIFNRSLSQEEILAIYNSTATNFEYSQTDLEEGNYNYSIYSMDGAGNLGIEERSFTVDTTGPGLELVFPTPENEIYTTMTNQTINFTFEEPLNKSFWVDWNNSLIGYWSFDHINSTGVFGNSSYERFGEFSNGVLDETSVTKGVRGQGLKMGGYQDYVELPFNSSKGQDNFTLSIWAKNTLSNDGGWDPIFGFSDGYYSGPIIFYDRFLGNNDTETPIISINYGSSTPNEEWNHFLVTNDASNRTLRVYINGVYVGMDTYLGAIRDSSPSMVIGSENSDSFNGSVDEAMVFNKVLTEEEILYLYNSTLSEFSFDKTDLNDSVYPYQIYSIDNAGNLEIESREFTVDTTDPAVSFVSPSLPNSGGSNGTFEFNVTIEDLTQTSSWYDINNSLIGYWAMDYFNSTGVFDNSSHSNSSSFGLFNGNVSEENINFSRRGKGAYFDGEGDYIEIVNSSRFNFTDEDFSFGGWIKRDAVPYEGGEHPIGKGNSGGITPYVIWMHDFRYNFLIGAEGCSGWEATQEVQTPVLQNETWYHIMAVKDGTIARIYLNGVEVDSSDIGTDTICSGDNHFIIGSGNSLDGTSTSGYFPGWVDEVMVFNRSLSSTEVLALYDSTSNGFYNSYNELENGTRSYYFSSVDSAGNFVKYSREFDVDFTNPSISYTYPTPANNSFNGQLTINATVYDRNLKNVTFNFGGTSYVLNITNEYSLNSKNYSDIWINATRVNNITNQWDLIITRDDLSLGQSYLYNVEIYDDGNNYNSTLERIIQGNNPPMFYSITQFPNSTLEMDPEVLINLTVNITDIDSDIDSYILQWKKYGENWTNETLTELSGTSSSKIVFGNFTPSSEGIYTYRFFANDSFGVGNYTQDRNISIYWDCEWSVNSSFEALAGYEENKRLGTLVIENLGDPEFANNNCTLNFRTTYDLEEGRVYFDGVPWKPQNFLDLGAKESFEILVNVTFGSEFTKEDLIITTTELGGVSTITSAETIATLITLSSGPYLYSEITESPILVYLTPQTFDLEGYVRNLMGSSTPNETNTAYNVSFYWTLPEGFSGTSSTVNYENLSENNVNTNSNTISFSDLNSFMPGVKTFSLVSEGVNNTGGNIIDSNGNTKISDSVNVNFLCYPVADSICVSECGNSGDPDCPVETVTIEKVINTGSGGGGSSETSFEISEDRFELVIGEKQEFPLEIENLMTYPKKNVKVTARNIGEAEIEISPSIIKNIPGKSSKEVQVTLLSKKYLVQGMYEIIFDIEGEIEKDGQLKPFTEKKIMQLFLVEISKEDAQGLLNESFNILERMQKENLSTDSVKNYIEKMNSSLSILDYGSVEENYKGLSELFEVASTSKKIIEELEKSISKSEHNGIDVLESKKTFFVAKSAFIRGDYYLAYQKIKEAQLTYALETKGKFNVIRYIQNEPDKALLILASFILLIFTISIITKYFVYKRRVRLLILEEKLFLELMKVVQKQCFEENKLSMGQYGEAVSQYELKLSQAVQRRVKYESKLVNLLNFRGEKSALLHEQKRLISLIKEIQGDYMIKGKLETRIYEGMVKSYSSRLTEVEERLIYIESRKALRGKGFFKALFVGGKNETE